MTCRDLVAFLMTYVSGELPADQTASFERHLAVCANCRIFLDQYRATIRLTQAVGDAPVPDLPSDLVAAIKASIAGETP